VTPSRSAAPIRTPSSSTSTSPIIRTFITRATKRAWESMRKAPASTTSSYRGVTMSTSITQAKRLFARGRPVHSSATIPSIRATAKGLTTS
jgi:hypothetical protein